MALGTYILMISVQQSIEYGVCIFSSIFTKWEFSLLVLSPLFYIWYVEDR